MTGYGYDRYLAAFGTAAGSTRVYLPGPGVTQARPGRVRTMKYSDFKEIVSSLQNILLRLPKSIAKIVSIAKYSFQIKIIDYFVPSQ